MATPTLGFGENIVVPLSQLEIHPPPCDCADCQSGYYLAEEQYRPPFWYTDEIQCDAATSIMDFYRNETEGARSRLKELLHLHGDVLINRWKKKSQEKRQQLLKDAVPHLEPQQWILPRYSYMPERKNFKMRDPIRRRALLLPWLNIEVLKSNPTVLFAILHFRTAYPLHDWAAFDCRQIELSWACGWLDVQFSPKCVVMHGEKYGRVVNWNAGEAHRADILGYPRARLVFEAQWVLMEMLEKIVTKALDGIEEAGAPRSSKWGFLVNSGFKRAGEIELWSPYTNQAFSPPPHLDLDYLVSLAETRLASVGDHLLELQNDTRYMRHYIKSLFATSIFKAVKKAYIPHLIARQVFLDITSYHWWRWVGLECQYARTIYNRHGHKVRTGHNLPHEYDLALGALELLFVNQVIYRTHCLESLLPYAPGFSKHWTVKRAEGKWQEFLRVTRDTTTNTLESLEDDPLDWILVQMLARPDEQTCFDHAMLFAFLQDHLARSSARERSRIDWIMMEKLSDISTCHEMLVSVRLHRPQNKARDIEQVKKEDREAWKRMRGDGNLPPPEALSKAGTSLLEGFYYVKPPTGPKNLKWLEETKEIRTALEQFWSSMRDLVRRNDFDNSAFHAKEIDDMLSIISYNLTAEYAERVENEEEEIRSKMLSAENSAGTGFIEQTSYEHPRGALPTISKKKPKRRDTVATEAESEVPTSPLSHPSNKIAKQAPIQVTRRASHVLNQMFPAAADIDSGRAVLWNDFVQAMCDVGFTARSNGGSAVLFENKDSKGKIVFHRPHPEDRIHVYTLRAMGRRMGKWFGWERERFVLEGPG